MQLEQSPPSASSAKSARGPMVMVYIGDDDPTRGDSHGFKGIGQRLAQKLNGRFHYLEDKHLAQMYPGTPDPSDSLKLYLRDHGKPDILLSRAAYYNGMMTSISPLMMVRDINEGLSSNLLGDESLVSHHLTPEIFDEHGKKFREQYKDIKSPIIAVMLVNINDIENFAQKMVSKCAAHDDMTVFICSSRRTWHDHYDKIKKRLEELAQEKGIAERLKIDGYSFQENANKENAFNPYIGLINEADHIIVAGESLSMVSEPLAAGKRVMIFEPGHSYSNLREKGLVTDFKNCAADTRFETPRIEPVNVTEDIANRLVDKFNKTAKKYAGPAGWVMRAASKVKNALGL
ncbi:MAG: ELM1/GtrOC1 family putative glycosyltransferase [Alphaproteobacteria bacterium]|nr:ELM1/GtrOC1 family putative glycosyltransferase [Alphaproteobacteria bacterium]